MDHGLGAWPCQKPRQQRGSQVHSNCRLGALFSCSPYTGTSIDPISNTTRCGKSIASARTIHSRSIAQAERRSLLGSTSPSQTTATGKSALLLAPRFFQLPSAGRSDLVQDGRRRSRLHSLTRDRRSAVAVDAPTGN